MIPIFSSIFRSAVREKLTYVHTLIFVYIYTLFTTFIDRAFFNPKKWLILHIKNCYFNRNKFNMNISSKYLWKRRRKWPKLVVNQSTLLKILFICRSKLNFSPKLCPIQDYNYVKIYKKKLLLKSKSIICINLQS